MKIGMGMTITHIDGYELTADTCQECYKAKARLKSIINDEWVYIDPRKDRVDSNMMLIQKPTEHKLLINGLALSYVEDFILSYKRHRFPYFSLTLQARKYTMVVKKCEIKKDHIKVYNETEREMVLHGNRD